MSKRKWRRGPHIRSLDELPVKRWSFGRHKPTVKGWFLSWQFGMAAKAIGKSGVVFYAMPAGITTRFSDEDILRAERPAQNTADPGGPEGYSKSPEPLRPEATEMSMISSTPYEDDP